MLVVMMEDDGNIKGGDKSPSYFSLFMSFPSSLISKIRFYRKMKNRIYHTRRLLI